MTIYDLESNIQFAIDTVDGITDNATVAVYGGNIYAVEIGYENGKPNPSLDKWHLLGEVNGNLRSTPLSRNSKIEFGNPREVDDGTTYTLPELAEKVHIDSWVEGISAMCNMDEIRKEVYEMAGMEEDEDDPICPAEFETEYTELAEKYNFRFNRKGQIVSYNLKNGKENN